MFLFSENLPDDGPRELSQDAEGDEAFLGDAANNDAPPAPKKKPKFFIYWNRRKPKFYDYNFQYGKEYYTPVVNYIDHKNLGNIHYIYIWCLWLVNRIQHLEG